MFLAAIMIYLLALLAIGAWFSRRVKDSKSFLVADRALPWYVSTGTIVATFMGAGSLIGAAGLAYKVGISAMWMDIGGILAIVALAFIAGRIRRFEGLTTPEILGVRFNGTTRLIAALIIIAAETAIVGYQIRAGAYVLNLIAGVPTGTGMFITAAFIIGYTMFAGMLSVAYTDLIQGITIIVALLVGLPFVIDAAGGISGIVAALPPEKLSFLGSSFKDAMKVLFPTFCLVFVMQPIWQRIFSCRDEASCKKAVFASVPALIFLVSVLAFTATIGAIVLPNLEDGGTVIIALGTHAMPTAVGVLLLCAAVAIIVSTGDSMLLSAASNIINDIYLQHINPNADEKRIVLYTRLVVLTLGIIALVQIQFFPSILAMVIYAYTMEGGLAPALLAAFYWKRATAAGGLVCVLAAGVTTVAWECMGIPFGIATSFITIIVSTALLIIVSYMTPPPNDNQLANFK
ncbi:MAG: sodium:solute symporter family protein [Cloacibacillus sp.]